MALKTLRDNLKYLTWILWLVIAIFIGMIFFEWGGVNRMDQARDQAAATVGGEKISYAEFENQYRFLESTYRQQFGGNIPPELLQQLNLPIQALDGLINEKILLLEARRLGLEATDAEVRQAILEVPVFKDENGNFIGEERYKSLLIGNRLNVEEFEKSVREDVLRNKLRTILAQTVYVSDQEVETAYREQAERAKIRYLQLPASQLADQAKVEPPEVAAYYEAHLQDFERPEQRRIQYLLVDAIQMRRGLEIPETELSAYYDDHPEEFRQEEQVRARHILIQITPERPREKALAEIQAVRAQLEGGGDFATLARERSEDEGSAERGGYLNYFGRGAMVKPFEDAAFGAPVGQLVGPVETDYGFHLIEVLDHRQAGPRPFQEAQGTIRARLAGERSNELAETKARELSQRITQEKLTSKEQWETLKTETITLENPEPFGRNDAVPSIGRGHELVTKAFASAVGDVSEPIKVPRGWAILRLDEVLAPRVPPLAEIEAQVRQAAELDKQKQLAVSRLTIGRQQLGDGKTLDQLATELGLEVKESNEFGKREPITGLGQVPEVNEAALALQKGQIGGPFKDAQGAVLFEVVERKSFDPQAFETARESTRAFAENERLNQLLTSLFEVRRRDLSPQYSADVLERFKITPQAEG